ncbi:MAG: hypothetical protein KC609_16050 [Myxococcales bacterium]|nr:hypothetical protein [Myxococcales bacterium]
MKILPLRVFQVLSGSLCVAALAMMGYWVVRGRGPYPWLLDHLQWADGRAQLLAVLVSLVLALLCALAGILLLSFITDRTGVNRVDPRSRLAASGGSPSGTGGVAPDTAAAVAAGQVSPQVKRVIGASIGAVGLVLAGLAAYLTWRDGVLSMRLMLVGLVVAGVGLFMAITGRIPKRPDRSLLRR